MIRRLLGACVGVAVMMTAVACDSSDGTGKGPRDGDVQAPPDDAGAPDAGDGGTDPVPDAGDGGTDPVPDAGGDGGTDPVPDGGVVVPTTPEGPWPTDGLTDYSSKYGIPKVASVGVDGAHNIWVLDGDRIGVLRADTQRLVWTSQPIGQAGLGFGSAQHQLATGSTVICGGKAGEAYVGYMTSDSVPGGQRIAGRGEPDFSEAHYFEFQKGDMDLVQLNGDGTDIVLREHLYRSVGTSRPSRNEAIGIRNSNDFHYDEDRSVYSCMRVMKGPYEGEVYIGTNHGVTRIRDLEYSSHRHPAWWLLVPKADPSQPPTRSQRAGYTYGLGYSQAGHLLIANNWKIGILPPNRELKYWDREQQESGIPEGTELSLYRLNTFVDPVNPGNDVERSQPAPENHWRGIQQTKDGLYYVAGLNSGLWQFKAEPTRHDPNKDADTDYVRIDGAGTDRYTALAATDDGSLFVGTDGRGLWRLTPQKQLEKVQGVGGSKVQQLVYDPRVTPSALYVLVDGKLYVLRGH
ncbi:hypothetical protein LXT21_09605 [Myxococcus sp. K38C18041901]|uniref:hypothetical protein n=1 Tax=Myxococcus guangdongensis TaxID=2906760 RepID=UPI0020A7A8EE|nr:hypothetical protein [Myxococcus guangdongensis]MCP3059026.1 hypothetical protein [Myxococcus guangdongensis]